ncbi:hypothetical protein M378DRAFT_165311 [Amanita muscaria Koide BX008]|uniref:Uncharacterized protein n=1 Tax=Amanita muscaria (strain Koide BX008) TaxID=946122 RepID=A0A0C2T893_AMAMK|nr:hypothetical protein M378DRAFT_165311 [Amanita muscaria Koide BX008]
MRDLVIERYTVERLLFCLPLDLSVELEEPRRELRGARTKEVSVINSEMKVHELRLKNRYPGHYRPLPLESAGFI